MARCDGVGLTTVLSFTAAEDNIFRPGSPVVIEKIYWQPEAAGNVLQIENGLEEIVFSHTVSEIGTAANAVILPVDVDFPRGLTINGLSLGIISVGTVYIYVSKG